MPRTHARRPLPTLALGLCLAVATTALTATGAAADADVAALADRQEIAYPGVAADDGVDATYVSFSSPLPDSAGPRPEACDRLGYLRLKSAAGPADPAQADAVYVTMPGYIEGAGIMEPFGRNVVRAAAERGEHAEVWLLDRRANCLEDTRGLAAADAADDPDLAYRYYSQGAPIDGHTFREASAADTAFLAHMGLAQTLADEFAVIAQLPPQFRQSRVMCGGHSLGGLITGALINWERDGVRGADQCAGYFVLDSRLNAADADYLKLLGLVTSALPGGLSGTGEALTGLLPTVPFLPTTLATVMSAGAAAALAPDAPSLLARELPTDLPTAAAARAITAPTYGDLLLAQREMSGREYSNNAALGALMDDHSMPIGYGRVSLGVFDTPVEPKQFPAPFAMRQEIVGIFGGTPAVTPAAGAGPVGWRNFDEVGDATRTVDGRQFTSPASEVTDIATFARSISNPVSNGFEMYFPNRLILETVAANTGDRAGDLAHLGPDRTADIPVIYLDAGDSGFAGGLDSLGTTSTATGTQVIAEGYNHVDLCAAAWRQNSGRPEIVSASLVDFASALLAGRR